MIFAAFLAGACVLGAFAWLLVHLLGKLGLLSSRHDPRLLEVDRELSKLIARQDMLDAENAKIAMTLHQMGAERLPPRPQQEVFDEMPGGGM